MKTIQIKESQLEDIFSNLKTTKNLYEIYENMDKVLYERYLSKFVGVYLTLVKLGLDDEWYKWQFEHGMRNNEWKRKMGNKNKIVISYWYNNVIIYYNNVI